MTKLRAVSDDDPEFIVDVLQSVIAHLPDQLARIASAHANQDWRDLVCAAHKAHSTTVYAGSEDLQNLIESIERDAGVEPRPSGLAASVGSLEALGDGVLRELGRITEEFRNT